MGLGENGRILMIRRRYCGLYVVGLWFGSWGLLNELHPSSKLTTREQAEVEEEQNLSCVRHGAAISIGPKMSILEEPEKSPKQNA